MCTQRALNGIVAIGAGQLDSLAVRQSLQ